VVNIGPNTEYFTQNRDYVIALKRFVKTQCQRFDYSTNYAVRELTKCEARFFHQF